MPTEKRKTIIRYTLKKSGKARYLRLAVDGDGCVSVVMPRGMREDAAHKFVEKKAFWILRKLEEVESKVQIVVPPLTHAGLVHLKTKALRQMEDRVRHYSQFYGFKYNAVCVRDQKSRWGSCSSNGNLNFNYKIIFLPSRMRDYVVVHEVCHLKELNHSSRFWNLVARAMPDYLIVRGELKKIRL